MTEHVRTTYLYVQVHFMSFLLQIFGRITNCMTPPIGLKMLVIILCVVLI